MKTDTATRLDQAVTEIAAGRAVVVIDDATRENEGDLLFAAAVGQFADVVAAMP